MKKSYSIPELEELVLSEDVLTESLDNLSDDIANPSDESNPDLETSDFDLVVD